MFPFLLNIVSNWASSDPVNIIVNDDSYVVEKGKERIVLPKQAAEKARKVENSADVRRAAKRFFAVCEADRNIKEVDFRSPGAPDTPIVPVPRERFAVVRELPDTSETQDASTRQQWYVREDVVVVTAVLEKTKRKWQFIWNGHKIYADITDRDFFQKLESNVYEFGQGDILNVDLRIDQTFNAALRPYENKSYHVERVHSHVRGPKQQLLFGSRRQ